MAPRLSALGAFRIPHHTAPNIPIVTNTSENIPEFERLAIFVLTMRGGLASYATQAWSYEISADEVFGVVNQTPSIRGRVTRLLASALSWICQVNAALLGGVHNLLYLKT